MRRLGLLILVVILAGCGNSSEPAVTPPAQKLTGTYRLSGFTFTTTTTAGTEVTSDRDFPGYSGTIREVYYWTKTSDAF